MSEYVIKLRVEDDCFVRARKILKCAGIRDGGGLSGRIAESVEV